MSKRTASVLTTLTVTGVVAGADSGAQGAAVGSPGVLSGNALQAPVHVPANVCGTTLGVVSLLNPAGGNGCVAGTAG
ncbi:chaplin [Streptomyces sp. NPDC096153]|uniref:chaplin n=1 Tax=Streptomyces sp. NPDC096153 TaxID=3155548 RepID=UPI00331A632F